MNFRDLRIGWRLFVKEPAYSAVVVLGLSVGFAACFLLLGYVRYSFSYDASLADADSVYVAKSRLNLRKPNWFEGAPLPFFEVARRSGVVESIAVLQPLTRSVKVGERVHPEVRLHAAHPSFAAMFGLRAIEGDVQVALTKPEAVAVTVSQAEILFGNRKAVGRTMEIGGNMLQVAAVLPDPPSNSTVNYGVLTGINTVVWSEQARQNEFQAWGSSSGGRLYLKLKSGASSDALNQVLQQASERSPINSQLPAEMVTELSGKPLLDISVIKLRDLYFDNDTANSPGSVPHGELKVIYGLIGVALLIVVLAMSNYVNLATVRTVSRQREIALRKLLGASIGRLLQQFFAESLIVSLIATAGGLLLAQLLLPAFSDMMGRKLDNLLTLANLAGVVVIGTAVGVLACAYPVWIALGVRPQRTLSGRGVSETAGALRMRRLLTVVQFSTAIALTAVTVAIGWQTYYASHADPGFNPQPLIVFKLPGDPNSSAIRGVRAALSRSPGVTSVSGAFELVAGRPIQVSNYVSRNNGEKVLLPFAKVSPNFFATYDVRALAGRLFDEGMDDVENPTTLVVNAKAARDLGFASADAAVGQLVTLGGGADARSVRIVGVVADIRFESLRELPRPLVYLPTAQLNVLTARAFGDVGAVERQAENLLAQYFPGDRVSVRRVESYYAENYAEDLRLAKLLGLASLIAIAIAAFGIYVLSAYTVQRMTKQIVIRKLYGAEPAAIARLVGREFLLVIGVSAAIAVPFAAWWSYRYLAGFVEHAPIGAWPLVAGVALALLITTLSTVRQTMAATRMSPASALRDS
jgi:ABC-type antimicrobial peptide transport system permease subunit